MGANYKHCEFCKQIVTNPCQDMPTLNCEGWSSLIPQPLTSDFDLGWDASLRKLRELVEKDGTLDLYRLDQLIYLISRDVGE